VSNLPRTLLRLALAAAFAFLATWGVSHAQGTDPALDARLKALEKELRCLVCQNQTLADSDAGLADDLRREVRALALAGKSNEEIKQYLVARYGDFVLYSPPVKTTTWLLWFGPLALLVVGGAIWLAVVRRRARVRDDPVLPRPETPAEDLITQARQALYEEP
jgi:cytochrome c-type biogenesis protein CcmH